jgi:hypothetical protein
MLPHYYSGKRAHFPLDIYISSFISFVSVLIIHKVFGGLLIWLEHKDVITLLALLLLHLLMVVVVLYNWYKVESLNPEDDPSGPGGDQLHPGVRIVCFDQSRIASRYCATCRKQVYGLDHVSDAM